MERYNSLWTLNSKSLRVLPLATHYSMQECAIYKLQCAIYKLQGAVYKLQDHKPPRIMIFMIDKHHTGCTQDPLPCIPV